MITNNDDTNVANNVAQANSQDLTEQWKKGELESGWYYVKNADGVIGMLHHSKISGWYNVQEVLAPVPSYEEWQELKEDYVDKHDKYLRLSTTNHQLRKIIEEFNTLDVAKENQQLKEILYKCREKLDELDYGCEIWQGELTGFIEEIDNAIGEKK